LPGWPRQREPVAGSIAVHPEDPDVIYVGSGFDFSNGIQGKLFKTTDGGRRVTRFLWVVDRNIEINP
jgi:hypothetical protein